MGFEQESCAKCGRTLRFGGSVAVSEMRPGTREFAGLAGSVGSVCLSCYGEARIAEMRAACAQNQVDLEVLEQEVVKRIEEREARSQAEPGPLTVGQKAADSIARFGGSWTFVLSFLGVLTVWVVANSLLLASRKAFDPYPFILLNLVLSCVAAMQAPIIMMSQNRVEERDRLRAEEDYRVNLRAEIEVQTLHEKVDHLLRRQMKTVLEFQDAQMDILDRIARSESGGQTG